MSKGRVGNALLIFALWSLLFLLVDQSVGAEPYAEESAGLCGTPLLHGETLRLFQEFGTPDRISTRTLKALGRVDAKGKPVRAQVGEQQTFWATNMQTQQFYQLTATLQKIGTRCYIYLENGQSIISTVADSIANEFDTTIYPTDTSVFGSPPNVDGDSRITILLLDIQDDYSGPGTAYYAGYFHSINEYNTTNSNFREMFYMDINPLQPGSTQFFGTLAHEFQHMIHFNQDITEDTWVNEGCSTLAEYLCGYGHDSNASSFLAAPDNSLLSWDNELADYGQVYLFFFYLWEKYGGSAFISSLVQSTLHGTAGIDAVLGARGYSDTFSTVFPNWAVANYVDNPALGGGKYGYTGLDITSLRSGGIALSQTYSTYPVTASGSVQHYAADYLKFTGGTNVTFAFNGDDANTYRLFLVDEGSSQVTSISLNAGTNDGSSATLASFSSAVLIPISVSSSGTGTYTYSTAGSGPGTAYTYYLPYFSQANSSTTGMGVANNSSSQSANVSVTVYGQSGTAGGGTTQVVPARGQKSFMVTSGSVQEGWMQVGSDQPLSGLCFVWNADTYMADIPMASATATSLVVPHVAQNSNYDTTFLLCNPNNSSTTVALTYVTGTGQAYSPASYSIPAMGSTEITLSTLLGGASASGGKVEIAASQGIAGFALYDNLKTGRRSYAGINAVALSGGGAADILSGDEGILLGAEDGEGYLTTQSSYTYYLPYFSQASSSTTGMGVANNSSSQSANVSVTVYGRSGTAGGGTTQVVAARGQNSFMVTSGSVQEGWMLVGSDQPLSGLCFVWNADTYMADIPMASATATSLVVPHVAQNSTYDTTFLLCNPNASSTTVTLTYVNGSGQAYTPANYSIPAMGSAEIALSTLLGGASAAGGKVEICAAQGVAGFALYDNLKTGKRSYAGINAVALSGSCSGGTTTAEIVPGDSMAEVNIGDTYALVVLLYGVPSRTEPSATQWVNYFWYDLLGLSGVVNDADHDEILDNAETVQMVIATAPYSGKTAGDNGIGSSLASVRNELGWEDEYDSGSYWYHTQGIVFNIPSTAVTRIGVFSPTAADLTAVEEIMRSMGEWGALQGE